MNRGVVSILLLAVAGAVNALPFPAVQILQGPPPGNYCAATGVPADFYINSRPGDRGFGRITYRVNGIQVYQGPLGAFNFPAGFISSFAPMPPNAIHDTVYPPGTVFSSISTYFDSARIATYENELTIQCDTGQTLLIRNTDLSAQPIPISPFAPLTAILVAAMYFFRRTRRNGDVIPCAPLNCPRVVAR